MISDMTEPWSAIVLAGGRATRLDGVDKAGIEIRGRTLLAWCLDALVDATEVVVVGDAVPTERPVTFVREEPQYGGPVAAVLTGLDSLLSTPEYVAVVAADMPYLTPRTHRRLVESAHGRDGSALIDPDGRRQLALVLSTTRLAEVRPGIEERHGMSLARLLEPFDIVDVPPLDSEYKDIDSWDDLAE